MPKIEGMMLNTHAERIPRKKVKNISKRKQPSVSQILSDEYDSESSCPDDIRDLSQPTVADSKGSSVDYVNTSDITPEMSPAIKRQPPMNQVPSDYTPGECRFVDAEIESMSVSQEDLDESFSEAEKEQLMDDLQSQGCGSENEIGIQNSFLQRLESVQMKQLNKISQKRNPLKIAKSRTRRNRRGRSRISEACEFESVEDEWESYLERVSKSFFRSKEATLEDLPDPKKGKKPYQGIPITPKNNSDMMRIYELSWKSREDLGQSMGTYEQFRIVVGQYSRFAIAARICPPNSLWKTGMLFNILCSIKCVQAFIRAFQIRSSAGTVMNKALHLIKLARYADSYFAEKISPEKRGHLSSIVEYLHGVARTNKNECRRQASERKEEALRSESNVYLAEEDIEYLSNSALDILNDIISSCNSLRREKGSEAVVQMMATSKDLLKKWNLNFLSSLMLLCGGQRPQVYCLLEAPSGVDFIALREKAKSTGSFPLRISYEKRIRSIDLPSVLIPSSLFRVIKFHCLYVLPAIFGKHEIDETDARRKCLLLHTENGDVLASRQVTGTIRTFLKRFDPELGKVSAMTLRASYATMMLTKHRRNETFGGMGEDEFLSYLAKIMNTSPEQLRETYISTNGKTFEICARILSGIIDRNGITAECTDMDLDLFGDN